MTATTRSMVAMAAANVLLCATAMAAPNPLGTWMRADGAARISIAPCGQKLCAVNTWVRDPEGSEKVGDTLVMTLKESSPSAFKGEAYDQRRGMTYAMTLSMNAENMQTNGCVALGLLCKAATWTRSQ